MKMRVGDETGVAMCILNLDQNLKINSTIELTECRIYNFKNI